MHQRLGHAGIIYSSSWLQEEEEKIDFKKGIENQEAKGKKMKKGKINM